MFDSLSKLDRLERNLSRWLPDAPQKQDESQSLLDFVPAITSGWQRPEHLADLAAFLESGIEGPGESYFTVPPRHGKSELLLHGIAYALARRPDIPILYATHTATFAAKQSKRARKLTKLAGVNIAAGSNRADEWEVEGGGGLVARGVGGEVTGRGFKLILIDDPLKSREVAESFTRLEAIWEWLKADVFTRGTPDAAVMVVHTRWHPDDPIGKLISELGWTGTTLQAINDDGAALWPELWPAETLLKRRGFVGEYNWASLFQGSPRPRGGAVFGEPSYYDELPRAGYSLGHGVDLAYSKKTHSDYSVCISALRFGDVLFILDMVRAQVDAPAFTLSLKAQLSRWKGPMVWHASGTEKGAGQFIRKSIGPDFKVKNATGDKFTRSIDVAAAWNDGRVLLPRGAPWVDVFLGEVCAFTGVDDRHDDMVDALASAHDAVKGNTKSYSSMRGRGGQRRM